MSFLNPVNEPVLRFKSTDAGAPQINYNARTAGDVKAVLKACLVTGYGDTDSAGWSAVNEDGHKIEFVSPSAAMSDYRLGIDDTSVESTIWRDTRAVGVATAMGNPVSKDGNAINKTHADNGWDMLVTQRGFLLIENVVNTAIKGVVSRITYYGQQKKTTNTNDKNISWWCVGHNAPAVNGGMPSDFFDSANTKDKYFDIGHNVAFHTLSLTFYKSISSFTNISSFDFLENWYLTSGYNIVAQQPAIKLTVKTNNTNSSQNKKLQIAERDYLQVWPTRASASFDAIDITSHAIFLIALDYWEY